MSSGMEAEGLILAAVALPVAAAFGAGWLAWQSGKLLVGAGLAVESYVADKKRQLEEEARQRKMSALAAHAQLVDMCTQIAAQIKSSAGKGGAIEEMSALLAELESITSRGVPSDVGMIESATATGFMKVESIIRRQKRIADIKLSETGSGLYHGLSVADLMDGLRVAISATEIRATQGSDVRAADPVALERAKLNEKLATVVSKVMLALEHVSDLTENYGLTTSASAWFHSCFNGADTLIESMCRPTTSNKEIKSGIRRLEESLEQYNVMIPGIEREAKKMHTLYQVYLDASKALGEEALGLREFKKSDEIEKKLEYLQTRARKAEECAEIYRKLGPEAYLCYAWDMELRDMGYEVHSRQKITEMAEQKPKRAVHGDTKLPFYEWSDADLTQLYSVTDDLALQLIVHEDGAISMQTIADGVGSATVEAQKSHCSQMKQIRERLKKNWFISYDLEETESPEEVTTVAAWRASDSNVWTEAARGLVEDKRKTDKTVEKARYMN